MIIRSTQTSGLATPGTTKLQSRRVTDCHNLWPQELSLVSKQDLRAGLSAVAEATQDDLELVNLLVPVALVELVYHKGSELVGCIVCASLRLFETNVAGADADDGVPVGLGDCDVRVVLVGIDVEVERLLESRPIVLVNQVLRAGHQGFLGGGLVACPSNGILGELLAALCRACAAERSAQVGEAGEAGWLRWASRSCLSLGSWRGRR